MGSWSSAPVLMVRDFFVFRQSRLLRNKGVGRCKNRCVISVAGECKIAFVHRGLFNTLYFMDTSHAGLKKGRAEALPSYSKFF